MVSDISSVMQFYAAVFLVGVCALPLSRVLFRSWFDRGWLLSKALGMALVTFFVLVFGISHLVPFGLLSICLSLGLVFGLGVVIQKMSKRNEIQQPTNISFILAIVLEIFFLSLLILWSYIKAHEPTIRSLEKFMDFGFPSTILNTSYFPPPDFWYAGETINYYYFGHLTMAILTKLSGLPLTITYNVMLALLFALCFSQSFAIGFQLYAWAKKTVHAAQEHLESSRIGLGALFCGLLTAYLVTLAGNMQTIYAFTKGYSGEEAPPPFWNILYSSPELLANPTIGFSNYWYANATRFIPFTIHEFPSYSFVVSDVHGHVLSIPFVLLITSLFFTFFIFLPEEKQSMKGQLGGFGLIGLLVGMAFMTNALDGPIYLGMGTFLLFWYAVRKRHALTKIGSDIIKKWGVFVGAFFVAALPFLLFFKSFVSGVAIDCPPANLASSKIGPIIFETVDKCQKSPFWMLWLLWGFFIFCAGWFFLTKGKWIITKIRDWHIPHMVFAFSDLEWLLLGMFLYAVMLIIVPEFIYFKDIYPAHFRSNTMFKLGYQAFILFSIVSGFGIVSVLGQKVQETAKQGFFSSFQLMARKSVFILLLIPQLFLVGIFPYFSVRSYFGNLETYKGLAGDTWFIEEMPDDYALMQWLKTEGIKRYRTDQRKQVFNTLVTNQHVPNATLPIIVEADGDSYTDYNRMSVFAGVPTIVGWAVHEWLWRGSYDVVSPRREAVRQVYEATDANTLAAHVRLWNVRYIIVGKLEKEKYPNMRLDLINQVGQIVYQKGESRIYEVN